MGFKNVMCNITSPNETQKIRNFWAQKSFKDFLCEER